MSVSTHNYSGGETIGALEDGVVTTWPDPAKLMEEKRFWKFCVCRRALYVIHKNSSKFKLPPDFNSMWPFNQGAGFVIHGTREDTERCQARVLHFTEFPHINHKYAEAMQMEERAQAVHDFFNKVKVQAIRDHKDEGYCICCRKPWLLVYDPGTGEPLTVHRTLSDERQCAILARILRGAKP